MKSVLVVVAAGLAAGCASPSYRPVQESAFDQLADHGCRRSGDRFSVTAQVNSTSKETIVLWNGHDNSRTVAVNLPSPGVGSRLRGAFGKNRYELGYERLSALSASGTPITFTMRCEAARMAPVADRFSYFEAGRRIEFEY
jgi:hypothetical protein